MSDGSRRAAVAALGRQTRPGIGRQGHGDHSAVLQPLSDRLRQVLVLPVPRLEQIFLVVLADVGVQGHHDDLYFQIVQIQLALVSRHRQTGLSIFTENNKKVGCPYMTRSGTRGLSDGLR